MEKDYLERVSAAGQTANPLFNFLGVKVEKISRELTVLSLPLRDDFIQGGGVTAGGILATLADEAMAHAVLANLEKGQSTATIEMSVRYLRPIKSGTIKASARTVKRGGKIVTVESEVLDESDNLLIKVIGSFIVLK